MCRGRREQQGFEHRGAIVAMSIPNMLSFRARPARFSGRVPKVRSLPWLLLTTLVVAVQAIPQDVSHTPVKGTSFPKVQLNDNHHPAGYRHDHVLDLSLSAATGLWYPAGENEPGIPVQALRDANGPLQIPGPLIRVPAGTEIHASVLNIISGTSLTMHGLSSHPAAEGEPDAWTTRFGETSEVRFRLDVPGTYYYWGTTTNSLLENRYSEDSQLSGAIVVDPPGAAPEANEEIFVIGIWVNIFRNNDRTHPFIGSEMAVINGRSWPNTQRFSYTQGDAVHWRWIDAAFEGHPLHLHGFYFRVDSRGNGQRDNIYHEDSQRDMVVTERVDPGDTRTISWVPERPGNWLFHCHNPFHFRSHFPLPILLSGHFPDRGTPDYDRAFESTHDMGGMVLGVTVRPKAGSKSTAEIAPKRYLTLTAEVAELQRAKADESSGAVRAYRYFLGDKPDPHLADRAIGPPILLSRGEPVSITVRNRLSESTSVHWHGIELQSYYDGVADFGTDGHRTSPMIEPGQSFEVLFTPPRAGTFIYHTHMNDLQQVMAGLSGPLIVLDPGEKFDPSRDHIIFITHPRSAADQINFVFVNGLNPPEAIELKQGIKHRFRIVNFHTFMANLRIEIRDGSGLLSWQALAKDGRDLPENQRTVRPAQQVVSIGETYDFEFTPDTPGDRRLEIFDPISNKVINSVQLHVRQPN
jgi:FtsP/CotA-like multicopper oxidase with cupredoxin domain